MCNERSYEVSDAEGAKFLERDFNQCFIQMRHYDEQIWRICKFTFTAYTALVGISVGLYKYSLEKQVGLIPAATAALTVGVIVGLFMFCLTVRNRVYYVFVARYINEHRRLFLRSRPFGFANESGMYTNPKQPPFWNWRSSQSWFAYMIAALNALLLGALVVMSLVGKEWRWWAASCAFVGLFIIQVAGASAYLLKREGKATGAAIFGEE